MKKVFIAILVTLIIGCKGDSKVKNDNPKNSTTKNDPKLKSSSSAKSSSSMNDSMKIKANHKDYLVGKVNYSSEPDFVLVDPKYSSKEIYLREQTYLAFLDMRKAAKEDGVNLLIISGARNFNHQSAIWNRKWKTSKIEDPKERALDILKYSAMPMCSRHHWGTDFDLNDLESSYFESGEGKKVYDWLRSNAAKYGFCQVYTNKKENNRTGYEKEEWHWSYMPLSSQILESFNEHVSLGDITGFEGSETAKSIDVITVFVNGIANCEL